MEHKKCTRLNIQKIPLAVLVNFSRKEFKVLCRKGKSQVSLLIQSYRVQKLRYMDIKMTTSKKK